MCRGQVIRINLPSMKNNVLTLAILFVGLKAFSQGLVIDTFQEESTTDRIESSEAALTAVIDQPSPVVGCGQPVTLTATITGALEISWKRNGEFITGATTNTFVANQSGIYTVVVVSLLCQLESAPVEVILESPLSAEILSPEGTSACQGDSVLLQATGGNAEWQWWECRSECRGWKC